jgi:hypothetical protein
MPVFKFCLALASLRRVAAIFTHKSITTHSQLVKGAISFGDAVSRFIELWLWLISSLGLLHNARNFATVRGVQQFHQLEVLYSVIVQIAGLIPGKPHLALVSCPFRGYFYLFKSSSKKVFQST